VSEKIREQQEANQMSEDRVSDWVKDRIRQIEREQDKD
jgi:hypothetical protein